MGLTLACWALPTQANAPVLSPIDVSLSESIANLGLDEQLWGDNGSPDRAALVTAIDHSLRYLNTQAAATAYDRYPVSGITRDRVRRSLQRFRELLFTVDSPAALQAAVLQEFDLYQSIGRDGLGTVDFTGYFQPTYTASRVPTAEFRYPLYRLPPGLEQWVQPHPTRRELEGADGLQGSQGQLRGLELVWLRDRLEAFLVQVQGSARLQLTDGTVMTLGYAGRTDYPYTSIGRQLINDGKIAEADLTLPRVLQYFQTYPQELDQYLPRNDRFIFFRETADVAPSGSLGVPVTPERSIATDKSLMPPGALALIVTQLPYLNPSGQAEARLVSRYVLDQDTGGAIRGAGRVDIFMGTGARAGDRAGLINAPGQLYYLLLKN
ncbi:MAG: murein transglycosylase A [Leptolyngbyaceae cyanobacterium SL_7_1]|nr:murein transglycosylase A [Leptolyngbyaceae cyanobacterium SL_7_1]